MKRMKEQGRRESPFAKAVHTVVRGIRRGRVMTYGAVAVRAGFPGAGRAVGTLMKKNFDPSIPCHRVICSDGRVGMYNRGTQQKRDRLIDEGISIIAGKVEKKMMS